MFRLIKNIIAIGILAVLLVVFKPEVQSAFGILERRYLPCVSPVEYSIGIFDERFGMSQEEFLNAVNEAEAIWEKPTGRNLFEHKVNGRLKINLVYDSRQQATETLDKIDDILQADRGTYDKLNADYLAKKGQYNTKNKIFNNRVAIFESRSQEYEKKVAEWNKKGGAPESVYLELESERKSLSAEALELNKMQYEINNLVLQINNLASNLNQVAENLNLNVATYNDIGTMHGEEFNEGLYMSGPLGESIDIYQFENRTKLVRVLAHELGHALGIMEHVEDEEAVMYRLNSGEEIKATATDLASLQGVCKLLK